MKIRVTIDTDECGFENIEGDGDRGVFNLDLEGVYNAWYGSASYFVNFKDVKVLECKHWYPERERRGGDWVHSDRLTCGDCGHKRTVEERDYGCSDMNECNACKGE